MRCVEHGGDRLKDLLHGAGGAGQDHHAGVAPPDQPVFTQRVGEVLGNAIAEHLRGLVAIEPGRYADRPGRGIMVYPGEVSGTQAIAQAHGHGGPGRRVLGEPRFGREFGERFG